MSEDLKLNMNAYLPLRDVVFQTLREAILKGELKPGERLMELQLASNRKDWQLQCRVRVQKWLK